MTASATKIDTNHTINYKFNSGSFGTTVTDTFTATSSANTDFTKTVTVKTVRGDYSSTEETKTVYFRTQAAETMYTVSVATDSQGTLSSSANLSAGANTPANLPTATPKYGYKFKNWTGTTGLTITDSTSASGATVKATQAGTVTAHYEADTNMDLRIAGRFHVYKNNKWVNTFDGTVSNDWSDTGEGTNGTVNIPFVYDHGTVYKVETNASLNDLTTQISGFDPFFFVYDKDKQKHWWATSSTTFNTSTTSVVLSDTSGANNNLRFNSDSTDEPVTLYFDTATHTLSYQVPTYYTITCNTATGGSVSASPTRQKEGSSVSLTIYPSTGYQLSSITAKDASNNDVTLSGSGNSRTFTMPASNVTVTPVFSQIGYTLTKASATNGSFTLSPETTATYGQTVTVTCSPNANYEVDTVTYKETGSSGSGTAVTISNSSGTFSMPAYNTTVTVTFKEKLHTITVQTSNSSHGTVLRGSSTVSDSTTQIGYITNVELAATNQSGYDFDHWTVTRGTATSMIVNGTATALSGSEEQTISGATATSNFRFNGTATVKAYFVAHDYSLNAVFTHNNEAAWNSNLAQTTDTSDNTKGSLNIGDTFEVKVTLAPGYAIDGDPTFETGTGYITPTKLSGPTSNNNIVTFRYQATTAGMVKAKVTLKAATPTLSNVQIKNNTSGFPYAAYSNGATVPHYYLQPVNAKATTDSFSTLTVEYGSTTNTDSSTNTVKEVSIDAPATVCPTDTTPVSYTITITATNQPAGITTAATVSNTYYISVSFNDQQKEYYKLNQIWNYLIRESDSSNGTYYSNAATAITEYNDAYDTASDFRGNGSTYPAYNYSGATTTAYSNLVSKLDNLMRKANKTTVYVLTSSQSNDTKVTFTTNGNNADWNRIKMYSVNEGLNGSAKVAPATYNNYAFKAGYDGKVQHSSTWYYLYKFSYPSKAEFQVWQGSGSTVTNAKTGVVTGATEIGENYYVNASTSSSVTTCTTWADFGHEKSSGKKYVEIDQTQNKSQITTLFGITSSGSVVSSFSNPTITTSVTSIQITGPVGKASPRTYELVNTGSANYVASFPASTQGKYNVTYTTKFGTDSGGVTNVDITRSENLTLWVAYDDVTIYVDMNDNVGTPILKLKYFVNSSGEPVRYTSVDGNGIPVQPSGSSEAYLPYEMDLVTGSESIYRYTIKMSKLRSDYYIGQHISNDQTIIDPIIDPINISAIRVEDHDFGGANGYAIGADARITGEIWFKANRTHLTDFETIAYGSVSTSFVAVTEDAYHTVLASGVKSVRGTGVITDDNEIYHAQYAASESGDNMPVFGSVLKTAMNQEAKNSGSTYYFDKWVRMKTPPEGLSVNDANRLAKNDSTNPAQRTVLNISGAADYTNVSDLNFTSAFPYADGDGDYTYIALYKLAQSNDPTVRVEVTYEFRDYDTSDGNYKFDPNKETVKATYTKVIKIPLDKLYAPTNSTYSDFAAVQSAVNAIAKANVPYIKSNYFDYSYDDEHPATVVENGAIPEESKIQVKATMTQTAHDYTITVKNDATLYTQINGVDIKGGYQQTVELKKDDFGGSSFSNPVWKDNNGNVLAVGNTYTARYVSSTLASNGTVNDTQIIKLVDDSSVSAGYKSIVTNSTTTVENSGTNEILHHNFYIVDSFPYDNNGQLIGELVGGGVLFATGTYRGNTWSYRQTNAKTQLADKNSREDFINTILSDPYDVEYTAQTINNVGFRYKPFKDTEDVFRYSDIQKAYQTVYEGTNVNSSNYEGQKLRLFSFMVYKVGNNYTVVSSEGYGEVDRYVVHTN